VVKMLKQNYEWDFMAENEADYRLIITLNVQGWLLTTALSKSLGKYKRTVSKEAINNIATFQVDTRLYNVLNVHCAPMCKNVAKDIRGDGMVMLSRRVDKAVFTRKKQTKEWVVNIEFVGVYGKC